RSFWKDHKDLSLLELLVGSAQRLTISLAALNRKSPQEAYQPANLAVEALFFGHVDDFAGDVGRHHWYVEPGEVIGGDYVGSLAGNVVAPTQMHTRNQ